MTKGTYWWQSPLCYEQIILGFDHLGFHYLYTTHSFQMRPVFTISPVWGERSPPLSAQEATCFHLIKWSSRHDKEEIMTASNDCIVLPGLECGAIIYSIPGTDMSHPSLCLHSWFQWKAPGWWNPYSKSVQQASFSRGRIAFSQSCPGALSGLCPTVFI